MNIILQRNTILYYSMYLSNDIMCIRRDQFNLLFYGPTDPGFAIKKKILIWIHRLTQDLLMYIEMFIALIRCFSVITNTPSQ